MLALPGHVERPIVRRCYCVVDGRVCFGEVLDAKGAVLFVDPQHPRLRTRQQWTAAGVWTGTTSGTGNAGYAAPGIHYVHFRQRSF